MSRFLTDIRDGWKTEWQADWLLRRACSERCAQVTHKCFKFNAIQLILQPYAFHAPIIHLSSIE